jgi:hypothetical protein
MKTKPALLFLALPLGAAIAQNRPPAPVPASSQVAPADQPTPGSILAAQITAIDETKGLSAPEKQRRIAAAIRLALASALTKVTDPQQAARVVLELAQAAAAAVPRQGDLVFRTISAVAAGIPVLAGQTGLVENVREAIIATVSGTPGAVSPSPQGQGQEHGRPPDPDFHGRDDDHIVSPSR